MILNRSNHFVHYFFNLYLIFCELKQRPLLILIFVSTRLCLISKKRRLTIMVILNKVMNVKESSGCI